MDAVVAPMAFLIPYVVVVWTDKTSVVALDIKLFVGEAVDISNKTKVRCFGCPAFRTMKVCHVDDLTRVGGKFFLHWPFTWSFIDTLCWYQVFSIVLIDITWIVDDIQMERVFFCS